jgi:hypothetical protein
VQVVLASMPADLWLAARANLSSGLPDPKFNRWDRSAVTCA